MKKIYISSSLQTEDLKKLLKDQYEILENEDFYKNIIQCDIFVCVIDLDSTETGYQLALALEKYSKPTLALAPTDTKEVPIISKIHHPMYGFAHYQNLAEAAAFIKQKELQHFKPATVSEISDPSSVDSCDVCAV